MSGEKARPIIEIIDRCQKSNEAINATLDNIDQILFGGRVSKSLKADAEDKVSSDDGLLSVLESKSRSAADKSEFTAGYANQIAVELEKFI